MDGFVSNRERTKEKMIDYFLKIAEVIKGIALFIVRRKEKNDNKEKNALKERLLRYFEAGQRNSHGSFFQTIDMLLQANLFTSKESDIIYDILEELINKGFLEYQGGSYYLKGHAPRF